VVDSGAGVGCRPEPVSGLAERDPQGVDVMRARTAGTMGAAGTVWANSKSMEGAHPERGVLAVPVVRSGPDRFIDLTEPAVRPPTRCFSMSTTRITTETMAMSGAAKSWFQFCS
jgi:hypothetical protein